MTGLGSGLEGAAAAVSSFPLPSFLVFAGLSLDATCSSAASSDELQCHAFVSFPPKPTPTRQKNEQATTTPTLVSRVIIFPLLRSGVCGFTRGLPFRARRRARNGKPLAKILRGYLRPAG